MEILEALKLIEPGLPSNVKNSVWADLGCGSGVFTNALAKVLGNGNKIFAVDKQMNFVSQHEASHSEIEFIKANFERDELPFSNLDGILMASSLHYIKDKTALLHKLQRHIKPAGQWIIVEYDTEKVNQWVPYPITFKALTHFFSDNGFNTIRKIGERNSVYGNDKMYVCVLKQS